MTFLLYIGKNKDFLRKFSKLENVQMIYAQNYQDAITICIRLKVRENIIVLHEQGEMNGDIEQIGAFRKKFYQAYVVLITDRLTPEASKVYLNSGINDTVSLNITTARLRQKIDIINKRQELLYAHNRKKKDVRHFILPQWKRCFDILFSGAALVFLSPVFLLIAIAIRMESKGPVIYKSKRVGTNYTIFNFLKFRSMYTDADKKLKDLALKLSAEAASTNNVSYETLISQWLDQVVLAEKTKAQMEARDIMRENLNKDFLYFSPIGATLGRKERHIGFVESNYMSTMGALNAAILRQKNLEMTSASLKIMNPPLFPLTSSPTNARMIILASILGTLLFIIGYFLIIEILDRTLRDKIRTERITGGTVIGAYPKESKLRYRRYNKAINEMAVKQLSTALLPHLNTQEQRVINLLSTEEKDGKTHVARLIEEYWSSIGLNVRRITYDEDFLSEDSQYVQANNLKELCPDLEKDEILLIEHPVLKSNPLPPALLNEASINLLVVRANRTWKNTDQALYEHLLQVKQKEVPLLFYLTQADRNTVEDFTGQLPPYTNFKNMEYRLFQLGLTAIEYKGK